jgi:hypothetical protein
VESSWTRQVWPPNALIPKFCITYCESCEYANFELLSVVIRYFIADIWRNTFKLGIHLPDPKMQGFLGITPNWKAPGWWNPRRHILGWICVLWAISLTTTSRLGWACVWEISNKIKWKKACEVYVSRICRAATVRPITIKTGIFRGLGDWFVSKFAKIGVDRFNRFGSARDETSGLPWERPMFLTTLACATALPCDC